MSSQGKNGGNTEGASASPESGLEDRMESLSVFAGRIAHEFNNVMNSIMNTAALLKMTGGLTPETAELVDLIDRSTKRGAELTTALMGFARPGSPAFMGAEANALAVQAAEAMKKRLPPGIEVRFVPSDAPLEIRVDEMLFSQVMNSLSDNAAEAMGGKGTLILSVSAAAGPDGLPVARLSVRDTGTGVPEQYRKFIFDPLFSTRQGVKGAGMGLCRAFRLMKDQGGSLRLSPVQPETGAEFWAEFPVEKAAAVMPLSGGARDPAAGSSGREAVPENTRASVLLADDDEANRLLGARLLEKFGHSVKLARDGLEALQIFQAAPQRFDVLIADETMPGLTGSEVIAMARKIRTGLPAILITGNDVSNTSVGEGVAYVQKPYDAEAFLRLVASLAGK